jgi:hypothetical protein
MIGRLALAACALVIALPVTAQQAGQAQPPVQQLRIYELFDATREAFHVRFRDHALRIMARYGFDVAAMWEARRDGRPEFVYLLNWPSEAAMRTAWDGFLADDEWIRIKQESATRHGRLVGTIEDRVLRRTDYSPPAPIPREAETQR